VIHTDVYGDNDVHWDLFEVAGGAGGFSTDFSDYDTGAVTPFDWRALGVVRDRWSVNADSTAMGEQFLKHPYSGESLDNEGVSILRWDKGKDIGKVEAGKRYLMKIVVAETTDQRWDSAVFLECGGIRVIPVFSE